VANQVLAAGGQVGPSSPVVMAKARNTPWSATHPPPRRPRAGSRLETDSAALVGAPRTAFMAHSRSRRRPHRHGRWPRRVGLQRSLRSSHSSHPGGQGFAPRAGERALRRVGAGPPCLQQLTHPAHPLGPSPSKRSLPTRFPLARCLGQSR